jgi:hypothetical protein
MEWLGCRIRARWLRSGDLLAVPFLGSAGLTCGCVLLVEPPLSEYLLAVLDLSYPLWWTCGCGFRPIEGETSDARAAALEGGLRGQLYGERRSGGGGLSPWSCWW